MSSRSLVAGLVVAACLATGCNPSAKLVGKWEADLSQMNASLSKTKESFQQSGNPLAEMASLLMGTMTLQVEFQADGKFSFGGSFLGQSNSAPGTWRYAKSEGDVLVLMVKMEKDTAEREVRVSFTDNDHFEMVPPVGDSVTGDSVTGKGSTDGSMPGAGQKLTFVRAKTE